MATPSDLVFVERRCPKGTYIHLTVVGPAQWATLRFTPASILGYNHTGTEVGHNSYDWPDMTAAEIQDYMVREWHATVVPTNAERIRQVEKYAAAVLNTQA